jgi:glycosyltransferase involved in cell wall biosynthesis
MYRGLSISVVIPCFNEEEGIAHVLRGLPDYVDEVIVVDNN